MNEGVAVQFQGVMSSATRASKRRVSVLWHDGGWEQEGQPHERLQPSVSNDVKHSHIQ